MKIDSDDLQELSDNELMQQWHAGMSTLYGYMEFIDNGIAINKEECLNFNEYVELLKDEIIRRECSPLDPDEMDEILKFDLN